MSDVQQNEEQLKRQFAASLLREDGKSHYEKAQEIVGRANPGLAMRIAQQWISDPIVVETKAALLEEFGEEHFLPSKAEFSRELLNAARVCFDEKAKAALYRTYAEVRGFVEKPGTKISIDNRSQKVIQIDRYGSQDSWKDEAIAQQRALTAG